MTLLELLSSRLSIKQTSHADGGEFHCPCLKCGGTDRFMFWPEAGNFWCRQCGWKGDIITILREIDGHSYREAARIAGKDMDSDSLPSTRAQQEFVLRQRLLADFRQWSRRKYREVTDTYRALIRELSVAIEAYNAMHWWLGLYTPEEQDYWTQLLGDLYNEVPQREYDCDICTFDRHMEVRTRWWEQERRV